LLTGLNWPDLLNRRGLSVIVHEQPPEAQDDLSRTMPLVADRPACYLELLVHSVLVERAAFSSTSVRVMVIGKTWAAPDSPPKTYSAMANASVDLSSPDAGVIEGALKNGFVASIRKTLTSSYFLQH
jgi:hypothetical protein